MRLAPSSCGRAARRALPSAGGGRFEPFPLEGPWRGDQRSRLALPNPCPRPLLWRPQRRARAGRREAGRDGGGSCLRDGGREGDPRVLLRERGLCHPEWGLEGRGGEQKHTQEYGKIFKSHFGPQFVVSIADREMVAQVLRSEGRAPQRANMESWQEYRDLRGRSTGLISAEGEQWLKMRSVLRQKILKPKDVAVYSGRVNEVITDLIKRIYTLRSQEEDGETVTNVNNLFFKYSMEGVATILYECRLGCLENNVPQQTVEYIEALELMFSMFKTTMYAGAIPRWLRPFIPKPWREFCRSWDGLFKFSQIHVDNKLKSIQSQLDQGEEVNGGLLTYLLVSKELTLEEIYANMTEMLLAGVDTTSFTLSWATYMLAKHPEVQQRVYEEIINKLGKDQAPVAHDVPKLPLIRAVLKETLRLYPVLPGNGRVTQKDLIVGGYLIPKGTQLALCHYTTSYSEENFPMANEFRPERWLRKDNLDRVDNFGSIPFGYGIRSCIGKRVAELEIHLALIQMNVPIKHTQS
ncbi:cytochrome P450 27C1 isoform X2 [Numida meleagris]|uniref:cytochrome P450 27C1 isoform X2 n=1 Tax=Numida meleagris TaxID=8996 RepID=UPI000B3E145E|nr:cytochrome P450 27C1 isoform X2 [Numida meleagris]